MVTPSRTVLLAAIVIASCPSTPAPKTAAADSSAPTLQVQPVEAGSSLFKYFDRYVDVFGVRIVAAPSVAEVKLLHAATVAAEYLDNDEDGIADDAAVVMSLSENSALLVMFQSADELESSGFFEESWTENLGIQDLSADETAVSGRFDASLEEILHLLQSYGWAVDHRVIGGRPAPPGRSQS